MYKNLNKNIKKIWTIYYLIFFISILIMLISIRIGFFKNINIYSGLYDYVLSIISIIFIIIIIVGPKINYLRYKYVIKSDQIQIKKGIFFIKVIIFPYSKIQHITIKENPINKHFNLMSIKMFTVNKIYIINGLSNNEVIEICNYISESAGI